MTTRIRSKGGVLVLIVWAMLRPSYVSAQEAASSFAELVSVVKPGETIRITEASGRTTRGRLGKLSTSSLELLVPNSGRDVVAPQVLSEGNVRSIEVERRDSLLNGTLIGLAVGGLGGLLGGAANCGNYSCQAGPVAAAFGALFGGIGAGVGALTDLAKSQRTTIYESVRQRSSAARVSPFVSNKAAGVRLSVRF